MSPTFDEPRLTAFALGEALADDDLRAVRQHLDSNGGARALVGDIRALALELHAAYDAERQTAPGHSEMSRIVEFSQPRSVPANVPWRTHLQRIAAMVALSAGVLAIGLIYWAGSSPRPLASRHASPNQPRAATVPSSHDRMVLYLGEAPTADEAAGNSGYAHVRRAILAGRLPARESVRVRELVNHFAYRDPTPVAEADWPLAVNLEVASAPWQPRNRLVCVHWKSARDVDASVSFNPTLVAAYRRIGGESAERKADFQSMSSLAGQAATELFEIIPAGTDAALLDGLDDTWIRTAGDPRRAPKSAPKLVVKFETRDPNGGPVRAREFPLHDDGRAFDAASPDFQFAAAVAAFGQLLLDSPAGTDITPDLVAAWAQSGLAEDPRSERADFLELVHAAGALLPASRAGSS